MNNFKKILLSVSILTAINMFSTNCFAMEKNSKYIPEGDIYNNQNYDQDDINIMRTPLNKAFPVNDSNLNKNSNDQFSNILNKKTNRENENSIEEDAISRNSYHYNLDLNNFNIMENPLNKAFSIDYSSDEDNNEFKNYYKYENSIEEDAIFKNSFHHNLDLNNFNIMKIPTMSRKDSFNINYKDENSNLNKKTNIDKTQDINDSNKINLNTPLSVNRFLIEEHKKFIIATILSINIVLQTKEIIKSYNERFNLKNNYDILSDIYFSCLLALSTKNVREDNLILEPIKLLLKGTKSLSNIANYKELDYINLLSFIMVNFKKILIKSINETINEIRTLKRDQFDKLHGENFEDFYIKRMTQIIKAPIKTNNDQVYSELQKIDENDLCHKWLMNITNLIDDAKIEIHLTDIPKDNSTQIYKTVISGEELATNDKFNKVITDKDNKFKKILFIDFSDNNLMTKNSDNDKTTLKSPKDNILTKPPTYRINLNSLNNTKINLTENNIFSNNSINFNNIKNETQPIKKLDFGTPNLIKEKTQPIKKLDFDTSNPLYQNNINQIDSTKTNNKSIFEKPLSQERFFVEEYKKRVICSILKKHVENELKVIINNHIKDPSDIKKCDNCCLNMAFNANGLKKDNFTFRSTKFIFKLPYTLQEIFKNKDTEYIDLIIDIISNYKIIFKNAIAKTFKELPNLEKKYIYELSEIRGIKNSCNTLIKNFSGKVNINYSTIYDELKKFNEKDYCYQYFTNLECLIDTLRLQVPKSCASQNDIDGSYETLANIRGFLLTSSDPISLHYVGNIRIPEEKQQIYFKDKNFSEIFNS